MAQKRLSKLEYRIMEALWAGRDLSIREIQESFPVGKMPAYTTVQTTVYRMEGKQFVKKTRKIGNSHLFAATVSRRAAQCRLIDDLLGFFGGRIQPVMAHLVDSGKLSLSDVREAEKMLLRAKAAAKKV